MDELEIRLGNLMWKIGDLVISKIHTSLLLSIIITLIAITGLILGILSYRNTKKILKRLEQREEINK